MKSRFELSHAPEFREPGAELLAANPARHVPGLLSALPPGVSVTEVRRTAYVNFANDPCCALLLVGSDGVAYLALNELGPDAYGEVDQAGRALAGALGKPYRVGAPDSWPVPPRSLLARIFGYAA